MDIIFSLFILFVGAVIFYRVYQNRLREKRERLIESYAFPETISEQLLEKYPHLSNKQLGMVLDGLREYFHLCNMAGRQMVSMPSQVVDTAWHELILFTREYEYFCSRALGRFLHHTPAEAMSSPTQAQDGIKRAWRLSCQRENIKAHEPHRLPLLFAMDSDLGIANGFNYQLDCQKGTTNNAYCAGHIGCGSGCGGDSGGDGGSGCGGGCGGD